MNKLSIYPTSRALREISKQHKQHDGLLPGLMRMDDFEHRVILLEDKIQIDPLQRILLLRKAAEFHAFQDLKFDMSLVRFFTKSDALFKFFEELSSEKVSFSSLVKADAYTEFSSHIAILEKLFENYRELLSKENLIDKAFIPSVYKINEGFLHNYDGINIHLEGYLSRFELELLDEVAKHVPLVASYTTSNFNLKMQERFKSIGIALPNNKHVTFSITDKKVLDAEDNAGSVHPSVFSVEEREEQIAVAFVQIQKMVENGILPENIALIVPDENFKEHLAVFDHHNNLNFAMGYDYSAGKYYKTLEAIYKYWQTFKKEDKALLEFYKADIKGIDNVSASAQVGSSEFFDFVSSIGLLECPLLGEEITKKVNEKVQDKYLYFLKIFSTEKLTMKEWLFLWLKSLSTITIDDIKGGKVTVMGVLETRAVQFDGVVIIDFNEGVVPATSSKDQFLNSTVRAFADLPTRSDRESLQKQYYKRILEQAKQSVIIYSMSDNKLPSKFLYELGLDDGLRTQGQLDLFYGDLSQTVNDQDPLVTDFDALDIEWSASRLKTYLDCKRKYYYRYIKKLRAKEDDEMNEGAFLHLLLDHLHREKDSYGSKEEMVKALSILMDQLLPFEDVKVKYKKALWKEKLTGYVDSQILHFDIGWKVVEREKEFFGTIQGLRFKGRIDRIDQNEAATLVMDYKSGQTQEANRTSSLEKLTDFQMSIYHYMLSPVYQHSRFVFTKILESGKQEDITVLEKKNELLLSHLDELVNTKAFTASKCEDLSKCTYCEFALMCERGDYL